MHPALVPACICACAFQTPSPLVLSVGSATRTVVQHCRTVRRLRSTRIDVRTPIGCTASKPESSTDQGVVPEAGSVVFTPGRWAEEDGVGVVEKVRYVESRGGYVVDVVQLRRAEADVFEEVSRGRGKSPYTWYDVGDVRVAPEAEYLDSRRAYRVTGARDGYAFVAPLDDEAKREADQQYAELKRSMLGLTALSGLVGTGLTAALVGVDHAGAFAAGATASLAYLFLLQASVDRVGDADSWVKKAVGLRFVVPAIPFIILARFSGYGLDVTPFFSATRTGIPKTQVAAIILGLLCYKVPVLWKTGTEALDSLAEIKPGTSGMIGTVASLAARSIRARKDDADEEAVQAAPALSTALVFAGPSGVGKSTLISMLAQEFADSIAFSVSHTTRPPRPDEQEGKDYYFVDSDKFDKMVENSEFIEHARVHDRCYGTSYESVRSVVASGKVCIIDVDIQGIEALRKQTNLDWLPRFVWVTPPSFEALEQRLRSRNTESEQSLKVRMDNAKRELTFAATNNIFDLTIINDDLQSAYAELRKFFQSVLNDDKR